MNVYAVIQDIPYEGYHRPSGIFSSKRKAQAFLEDVPKQYRWEYDIVEYTLDIPDGGMVK